MTFAPIVKDIVSKLNQNVLQDAGVTYYDIIVAINDEYVKLRDAYIVQGQGNIFAKTENVYVSLKDFAYPDFYYAELESQVLSTVPIQQAVFSTTMLLTNTKLTSAAKAYTKGTLVSIGNYLYKAVEDVPAIDSSALFFNNLFTKNYTVDNKLHYGVGELLKDKATGSFYRVTTAFQAKDGVGLSGNTEKVYWKRIGVNHTTPHLYNINDLTRTRLYNYIETEFAFSIVGNKLYIQGADSPKNFAITYIPEWEQVTDMETEVLLPYAIVPELKNAALRNVALKVQGGKSEPNS